MSVDVTTTAIPGLLAIQPQAIGDRRGWFMEMWREDTYSQLGIGFVQDNMTWSQGGVLRGLHFQNPYGQGKLITVVKGGVRDICLDVRRGSPTFGTWLAFDLTEENRAQLYLPPGIAHGFYVNGPHALFCYKCTDLYHPEAEYTVKWDDPEVGIDWKAEEPVLSDKDQAGICLADLDPSILPEYEETD